MEMILPKFKTVYMVGIGGTGMSGLARLLAQSGHTVFGSDEKDAPILHSLEKEGIKIFIGHRDSNLPEKIDAVIYSPAVPEDNAERIAAKTKKVPQYSYPQAVGMITNNFFTISVCGTHGKTTVTAMAAAAFIKAKTDPTVIVGAATGELSGKNERLGGGRHFLIESCEYRRGFLNYEPKAVIITNIELDHLDYYKDLEDYKHAFSEYFAKLPENGLLIANNDDPNIKELIKNFYGCPVITYGTSEDSDFRLIDSSVMHEGEILAELNLAVSGLHNQMNATAVLALCYELGVDIAEAADAVNAYKGASRRTEELGKIGSTLLIDDYGHHPTEIKATLKAIRQKYGRDKKILCIFQPHQYSRTKKLLSGFAESFADANEVIIPNILRARDTDAEVKAVSPEDLVKAISKFNKNVSFGNGLENTEMIARKLAPKYDIIVTMGAGDVYKIAELLKS